MTNQNNSRGVEGTSRGVEGKQRLRIAYLSVNDPLDKRSWSGLTYYIGQTLQKNVGDVHYLGPLELPGWLDRSLRAIAKINRILFKKEYDVKHSLLISWYAARVLKRRMGKGGYDCIVAPAASTELSYFRTDIPVVYISDTTYKLISNYYVKEFRDLLGFSRWEGNLLEKRSLEKSSLIIYSSHWAADSARQDYGIGADKLAIMPFGANMDHAPDASIIYDKEKNGVLTMLFLAVDWERKGGSIAFDALRYLREKGVPARLVVCGCAPPDGFSHPDMEVIPFLNKNKKEDHDLFVSLLSSVHFLILPTRADCSLIVACESNSYGVPAIATATGGVPDVVEDGVNGYCLSYDAEGPAYGELIASIFSDRERYRALVASSRKKYEEQLNWDKWSDRFRDLFGKVNAKNKRSS